MPQKDTNKGRHMVGLSIEHHNFTTVAAIITMIIIMYMYLQLSVCKMEMSKRGIYSRGKNPYIEVVFDRKDPYDVFVSKAAAVCDVRVTRRGQALSLFKLNGARVLNEPIVVRMKKKNWTIGNYLQLIKRGPSSIKLGIGIVQPSVEEVLSSSDSDVRQVSIFMYANSDDVDLLIIDWTLFWDKR